MYLATRDGTIFNAFEIDYLSDDKPVNHVGNTDVFNLRSEESWIDGDYMYK